MSVDFTKHDKPYVAVRSEDELSLLRAGIGEDPAQIDVVIEEVRSWVQAQHHFTIRTDDYFMLLMLRLAKWNKERAKSQIERFCMYQCDPCYRSWTMHSSDEMDSKMMQLLETNAFTLLPKRNPKDGSRVLLIRLGLFDFNCFTREETLKFLDLMIKIRNLDYTPSMNGILTMFDFTDAGLDIVKNLSPPFVKRFAKYLQEACPHRVHSQHMLNLPHFFRMIVEVYKKFSSEKIQKRIWSYGQDYSLLLRHVDPSCLPVEYGGTAGTLEDISKQCRQHILAHINELDNFKSMSYTNLKPFAQETTQELTGVYRKLQVD